MLIGILLCVVQTLLISGQIMPQNEEATAVNEFTKDLQDLLCEPEKNCAISGYSIFSALGLTYAGARGKTQKQIQDVLNLSGLTNNEVNQFFLKLINSVSDTSSLVEVVQANRFYGANEYPFLQSYLRTLQQFYKADAQNLDFRKDPQGSRQKINSWVEQVTKNLIKAFLPPNAITTDTISALTNALYFKANWIQQFDNQKTQNRKFSTSAGDGVDVPTMTQKESYYIVGDIQNVNSSFIQLPYRGEDASMYIVVPKPLPDIGGSSSSSNLSIYAVVEDINLSEVFDRGELSVVNLYLPKFTVEFFTPLSQSLEFLGMVDAFDATKANFSGMVDSQNLYISEGYHKTKIIVNEIGTEAAAATSILLFERGGIPDEPIDFTVDEPFAFYIVKEPEHVILFSGIIEDPLAG